jgi:hypothetical protein
MLETLLSALAGEARARARRAGYSVALMSAAAVFVAIAIAALLVALFFWLDLKLGPIESALVIAAGALVLAVIVSGPLWWPKPAPPPPPPEPTLAQFIALVAKNGTLTPRQMALGAVLGAMALGLMRGGKKDAAP